MAYYAKLVAFASFLVAGSCQAGYAQLSPPSNWTTSAGASLYKAAANDVSFSGGVRAAEKLSVNVGGRAVAVGAAYRFAANAPRVAASFAFGSPLAILSLGLLAYSYYQQSGFTVDPLKEIWVKDDPTAGIYYRIVGKPNWHLSKQSACDEFANQPIWVSINGAGTYTGTVSGMLCTVTFTNVNGGPYNAGSGTLESKTVTGLEKVPATRTEFEEKMALSPLPVDLPQLLPVPLPVEPPILNPSSDPVPVSQPLRVPLGDPVPVPNSNPQQWKSPVVDVVPSPVPSSPFRVDLQPKDIVKTDATPLPETAPVPVTPPADQTETPKEDTPGMCDLYPDILACAKPKLGSVEPEAVTNVDKAMTINADTGWGPSAGACPAPKTFTIMNVSLSMPFTLLCDFATAIKPLLIAFAWLSAALTFFGMSRKD